MLDSLINQLSAALAACLDLNELQNIRSQFLGKSSEINNQMKELGQLPGEARKEAGQKINVVRDQMQDLIESRRTELEAALQNAKLAKEKLDLSLPARSCQTGSIHPITQCMEELTQVFSKYGFTVMDGPDIEDDWYNFTALNIAENHPARQMHDTFYLRSEKNNKVLRTHTSPIQIRTMQNGKPPFRFIAPGRTYRSDSDMTHTPMFHQIEGLVVDKGINMGHLKYVIIDFIRNFFENANIEVQFRPSFFPFTEPSAEVDIRMDKNDRWLEVLGCGMIHPNVLHNVGINPDEYQGFAFGMGVERFAMLKYGMKDLRKFFEGDKRWLNHYNFKNFDIPTLAGGLTR
jgi:phenylalanyl-tRNA synthetase alpha chain